MKTTFEIPDELYREIKALAATTDRRVKDLVAEALRERLERERRTEGPRGWRSAFGKVAQADVQRVQAIVDDELSTIEPEDWR